MRIDISDMKELSKAIKTMKKGMPEFLSKLVVAEAKKAADTARKKTEKDGPVNTGDYMKGFMSSERAKVSGRRYSAEFYNRVDYAIHLEYGFRSHWVPGYWIGATFVYDSESKTGMYVGPKGGFVPGTYIHRDSTKETERTQKARIKRKFNAFVRENGL